MPGLKLLAFSLLLLYCSHYINYGLCVIMMCQYRSISCKKCTILVGDVIVGKLHMYGGQRAYSYLILLWRSNYSKKYSYIYIYNLLLLFSCSVMSYSFTTPRTIACQAPLPMRFPRQEYMGGLPFLSWMNLPDQGIKPMSLASPALAGGFFTTESPGKPALKHYLLKL